MAMDTQNRFIKERQTKEVDELHCDSKQWQSHLRLMQDELNFLHHLLNSYVFEPNTPNLFERLQDFIVRLKKARTNKLEVRKMVSQHEKDLGGMLECIDSKCFLAYYRKHEKIEAEVVSCMENFQNLKTEIFEYAGSILKRRKPHEKSNKEG